MSLSPQCKVVIKATLINLLNTIWFAMNQARFNNKMTLRKQIFIWSSLTPLYLVMELTKFQIIRSKIYLYSSFSKSTFIIQMLHQSKSILWQPPLHNWIKCNIHGASNQNSGNSSCGGIFRSHNAYALCCFVEPMGI